MRSMQDLLRRAGWTDALEEEYRLVPRGYGVAIYRRLDGARVGGYYNIEAAIEHLSARPGPEATGPNLPVADRTGPSDLTMADRAGPA